MCGILGSIGLSFSEAMVGSLMRSRGPDAFRRLQVGDLTIYHSRLAVVGTAYPESTQPISIGALTLLCNGYISNFEEINSSLDIEGHSDCATIARLYFTKGFSGLSRLRGQFAAALIDGRRNTLVLLRDATGICPLYYAHTEAGLIFGSQASWVAKLVASAGYACAISDESLRCWQSCGYVVGPSTLLTNIEEVPTGTALEFDMTGTATGCPVSIGCLDQATTCRRREDLSDLLLAAVARNLKGDFEPWILLSGGLDSTLILHCAVEAGLRSCRVVGLRYPDESNVDELNLAKDVATFYGQTLDIVEFSGEDRLLKSDVFSNRVDWPLDGGSLLPKLVLADHIRRNRGRVALGGTGADECFGGYRRHRARAKLLADEAVLDEKTEHRYFREWIAPYGDSLAPFEVLQSIHPHTKFADPAFIYDLMELSQMHNPRVDSCFANAGIEYRPPFQDADVVGFAASLPLRDKTSEECPKHLLRSAFRGRVHDRFLNAPKRPLRFGSMGPNPSWRLKIWTTWWNALRPYLQPGATQDSQLS